MELVGVRNHNSNPAHLIWWSYYSKSSPTNRDFHWTMKVSFDTLMKHVKALWKPLLKISKATNNSLHLLLDLMGKYNAARQWKDLQDKYKKIYKQYIAPMLADEEMTEADKGFVHSTVHQPDDYVCKKIQELQSNSTEVQASL
eukprot:jgi/Psemu1/22571/gm1.22571_g